MLKRLQYVASYPTITLGLRLILLRLLRKGEDIHATGDEINFENVLWTIPKARMKADKAHNIHLDDHPGANHCGTIAESLRNQLRNQSMSIVGDLAATSDGASGNDVFSLYVCYLDDSDRSNISRRPTPFPTFSAM